MHKNQIAPSVIQDVLESAANAAEKGQAQWHTPLPWAQILALPLVRYRTAIADLSCGNGQLLAGASKRAELLGCDIEKTTDGIVQADITKFYSLLRAVNWKCDLFVLNPPWDLHWYKSLRTATVGTSTGLAALAESHVPAVCRAFVAHDPRIGRDAIDSTIATLCIALDCCSEYGEGFLIANEATLKRLIFSPAAPYRMLAGHIWAHLTVQGNICQTKGRSDFVTGIIYFARAPQSKPFKTHCSSFESAKVMCEQLKSRRLEFRKGPEATSYMHTKNCADLWQAAADEYKARTSPLPHYNIWLDENGIIRTFLSLFDEHSGRVSKDEAAGLYALSGRKPIHLVVQRAQRKALEAAVNRTLWRVDPKLQEAVKVAVTEYNNVRAPLYPLSKIQRLGYLDEQDEIQCVKNLSKSGFTHFEAGKSYALRSTTVAVKRHGEKVNLEGEMDAVEWDGQELAFFITDCYGVEQCFMEARLRDKDTEVNLLPANHTGKWGKKDLGDRCPINFTLQELVTHFHIPDVPDVATLDPQRYQRHLTALDQIAALCN
ncbi:MAG TPA: hypothetical protein VGY56_02415 [Verrucomicrobiae bacterium]|nr:hypothetical protein [Verrucomicrobiae bacterium]